MTLRTGNGGRYRSYTRSIKARQGETGCKHRSIPMEKLDNLVACHIEDRLLARERLEEVLSLVLERRQERMDRRRGHIAERNKRATEADLRLKRLYDAIEGGVADVSDPALKERIAGLAAVRDQVQADAQRAQPLAENSARQAVMQAMPWSGKSRGPHGSACGSTAAVIAAITSARLPNRLKWRRAQSAS
jgi:hypothetical protein